MLAFHFPFSPTCSWNKLKAPHPQTCWQLSSAVGGITPDDEDDRDTGGRGCAAGISLDGRLSALYSGSEPRPLLELVTTASNRLSSRSMVDWLGLMKLTAGEAPAEDRPARECSVAGTATRKYTFRIMLRWHE